MISIVTSLQTVVDCGSLENPANGLVTVTGTTFDSTATYTCTGANYLLVGVSMRMCQADGFWSDNEPTCGKLNSAMLG